MQCTETNYLTVCDASVILPLSRDTDDSSEDIYFITYPPVSIGLKTSCYLQGPSLGIHRPDFTVLWNVVFSKRAAYMLHCICCT